MEAKEIAFWASEMVQELSRLGDYSVEAKAIRETLELVRDLGVSYHHPLPVPPFHRRVVTRPSRRAWSRCGPCSGWGGNSPEMRPVCVVHMPI